MQSEKKTTKIAEMEKKWYVAYVKHRHEKKVAERLKAIDIEYFLPIQQEVRQWKDRKKRVETVVIPMMLFVKATEEERMEVVKMESVVCYMTLRGEGKPAVIPEKEMERFIFLLTNAPNRVEMIDEQLQPGKPVKVIKGALKGMEGELVEWAGKTRVVVRLELLGRAGVEMLADMVEAL